MVLTRGNLRRKTLRGQPEILSPAGDMEKLKVAVNYGADAVYLGGKSFNLRAGAAGFDGSEMAEAIAYAHARGVKVYVTANAFPFEDDLLKIKSFLKETAGRGADAFIISDPGVFSLAREVAPDTDIHISTQANTTNSESVKFWRSLGAKRVILARECSLEDIKRIRDNIPDDIVLEAFVHGAMCVAYSGRCLLSGYLLNRGANQGECAQPCRYQYRVEEATRPGLYLPVEEDGKGTAIFSASDLCMVKYLPQLIGAGVSSFKIEGRMKTAFYAGLTAYVYRTALDDLYSDPALYGSLAQKYENDLGKCAHRCASARGAPEGDTHIRDDSLSRSAPSFSTGFYFGNPLPPGMAELSQARTFVGVVKAYDEVSGVAEIEQRNKFSNGDIIEVIGSAGGPFTQTVKGLRDENGNGIESAPHPKQRVYLKMEREVSELDLICK